MIAKITRFALDNVALVLVAVLGVIALGLHAYQNLTIEAFPDPSDPAVQIITLYPGQPAEEVERSVSIAVERATNGLPQLARTRSISLFGLSLTTLTFEDSMDLLRARELVLQRLRNAELPDGVVPELGPLATPIGEVYRYTLTSPHADPMTLRSLQDWVVRPELMRSPGVADVVSYGGLVEEVHIEPDLLRLMTADVHVEALREAVENASKNAGGGFITHGQEDFIVRSKGLFSSLEDISNSVVTERDGVPLRVGDLARVSVGHAPRQGIASRDGEDDAVEGIVLMRYGENPSAVLDALHERIAKIQAERLPEGVQIHPFYDRSDLVASTLHTVYTNLTEGTLLVIFVLLISTGSWRASLAVASLIPVALATSFAYLYSRGMSANLISMGAMDFGIIVDGAVIVVEHALHRVPKLDRALPLKKRIEIAAGEIARPTLTSLLIILVAYLPILGLQRVEGRIFGPMAHTVASALAGALVASFTLIPVLLLGVFRTEKEAQVPAWLTGLQARYQHMLSHTITQGWAVAVVALSVLAGSGMVLYKLGTEFLPELNEGGVYVTATLPSNLSLEEGRRMAWKLRTMLSEVPDVDGIITQLGRPEDGTDPKLPSNLELFVRLKPQSQWSPQHPDIGAFMDDITERLVEVPGIEFNLSQPIRDNVAENISGQSGQVALKIYGDDLHELNALALKARDALADVPGIADLAIVRSSQVPQAEISLDRLALAEHGLQAGPVQDLVATALGGQNAGGLWQGERLVDITVRLPPWERASVQQLRALPIQAGDHRVTLGEIASTDVARGRASITREDGQRYVGLRMNVRGRDLGSFVQEARDRVDGVITLPTGYRRVWGGEFENQQRAMKRLMIVVPMALLLTVLLLLSTFRRLDDVLMILVHTPLAMTGGVIGLAIAGLTLSVSAVVGFIALLGQAVLNGVLVVSSVRGRLNEGLSVDEAVIQGSTERFRGVLMTALLASLGLVPAALSHAMGSETQRPIAVVVVCGSLSAAALTLLVLPASLRAWLRRAVR